MDWKKILNLKPYVMDLVRKLIIAGLLVFCFSVVYCQSGNGQSQPYQASTQTISFSGSYPWTPEKVVSKQFRTDGPVYQFHVVDAATYDNYRGMLPQTWSSELNDCVARRGDCEGNVVITATDPEK